MKGKLKIGVPVSSNEMLAIGTEVEIISQWCGCGGRFCQCVIQGGRKVVINSSEIEITDYSPYIDWEQRRYELAKHAMQAYVSSKLTLQEQTKCEYIAISSINMADAMIKKLKGE